MAAPSLEVTISICPEFDNHVTIRYLRKMLLTSEKHVLFVTMGPSRPPRVGDSDPSVTWEREMSYWEARKVIRRVAHMTVPKLNDFELGNMGFGGIGYSLSVKGTANDLYVAWKDDCPNGWKSVWKVVNTLRWLSIFRTPPKWWQIWRW